jgi:hypothetical protein
MAGIRRKIYGVAFYELAILRFLVCRGRPKLINTSTFNPAESPVSKRHRRHAVLLPRYRNGLTNDWGWMIELC